MSGWEWLDRARERLYRLNVPATIVSPIYGKTSYPSTLDGDGWLTKQLRRTTLPRRGRGTGSYAQVRGDQEQRGAINFGPFVLIVEDEPKIRDLLREQLEAEGYLTEAVGNIAEARYCIEVEAPDLILLDLMLPIEHGWTFLQTRREDALLASIPVVAMSAAPEALLLEAEHLGADAFLSKPFDLDAMTALIHSFVG